MTSELFSVALVCATSLLLYILVSRLIVRLVVYLRVRHILVDLQLLLDSIWKTYSVKHITPLFVVNGIGSENLEELRNSFVREVLRVLSPKYKKFLLNFFTLQGLILYIGKYFDSRMADYLIEKEVDNVGAST